MYEYKFLLFKYFLSLTVNCQTGTIYTRTVMERSPYCGPFDSNFFTSCSEAAPGFSAGGQRGFREEPL